MQRTVRFAAWAGLGLAVIVPVVIAALSPLQGYRDAAYVTGSLAGVVSLSLLLVQPLLGAGFLPGLGIVVSRQWHRWVGAALVVAVGMHIGGLYVSSPADAMDALLLISPTAFSIYGVTAMWAVIATAFLVALRARSGLRPTPWRIVHNALACVVVVSTIVHAVMIEGTMGTASKLVLCALVSVATIAAITRVRVLRPMIRGR